MSSHSTRPTYVRRLGWLPSRMVATARSARVTQFALPPTTRASRAFSPPGNRHRIEHALRGSARERGHHLLREHLDSVGHHEVQEEVRHAELIDSSGEFTLDVVGGADQDLKRHTHALVILDS